MAGRYYAMLAERCAMMQAMILPTRPFLSSSNNARATLRRTQDGHVSFRASINIRARYFSFHFLFALPVPDKTYILSLPDGKVLDTALSQQLFTSIFF